MKKLFILDGAVRPAKPQIIKYIKSLSESEAEGIKNGFLVMKITTKPFDPNKEKNVDYKHVDEEDFKEKIESDRSIWFTYQYAGNSYGVNKDKIDQGFKKSDNVFLIIRNGNIIKKIKEWVETKYPEVRVIVIYVYTEDQAIENKYPNDEKFQEERRQRVQEVYESFSSSLTTDPNLYEEKLIFSGNQNNEMLMKWQIDNLLKKNYSHSVIIPKNGFFIHSYKDENIAKQHAEIVKNAGNEFGLKIKSLIFENGAYKIDDKVWESIDAAEYIVCDITPDRGTDIKTASPNIWLELGYVLSELRKRHVRIEDKLIVVCARKSADNVRNFLTTFVDFSRNIDYYDEKTNDNDKESDDFEKVVTRLIKARNGN